MGGQVGMAGDDLEPPLSLFPFSSDLSVVLALADDRRSVLEDPVHPHVSWLRIQP